MSRRKKRFSKQEALELLSVQLRKPDLPINVLAKLMTLYSKLSDWQSAAAKSEGDDLNKLVTEAERKRRKIQ